MLGLLLLLVSSAASGQTIGIQGPTSITVGTELVITCQPNIVGLKQVDMIELWKNTSTSAHSPYVSTYFVQNGMKSVIAWQNTVVKNRPGVNASGAVYPPANAQLRLTISQGNTVCTDAGAYTCVMQAVAKAVGAVAVTVEIEKYIAVNTAPDNTNPMTVYPSVGVNGQLYIYSVGTVVTFTCTMTVGTNQVDVQWCYKQANDNSFTGYPYFSHVNQGSGSIVSVGCNYRRTSVLTYNVTSSDTSTQFMCEPKSGSLCGSSADALRSNFTIANRLATTTTTPGPATTSTTTGPTTTSTTTGPATTTTTPDGPGISIALSPANPIYTKNEGDTLPPVTCTADCIPSCTFVWTRHDGTSFPASPVLSLGQLDRSEQGTYTCTAQNGVGDANTISTSVTVQYGPGAITFSPPTDVLDTVENQTIPDVTCSANCRPACNYIWSKGGTGYVNPLHLSKAERGNAGQYTCTAYNTVKQNTILWNLIVRYPPKILSLAYTSGGVDVSENGDTSLKCTVESYPASTIQWYYKANNTQLLSTPDTRESTYTLTRAGCLDTGVYTCSVSNSQSNTAVTMDIPVNVLCKPRLDFRQYVPRKYRLGLGENLAIPASFVSNPEPSYTWTFQNQNSSLNAVEELIYGKENFAIHNQYNENPLSAVSTGTRRGLQERWFGFYIVTATNNQGKSTLIYIVEAKGSDAEPVSGGSGPSSASVNLFIGSAIFMLVGVVLLFISICLMRRVVIRSSKRKDNIRSDVPLDNLRHSNYNVDVAQQGPVPIGMSNYEQMQPRDPPSVYQVLPPARQGNADYDDGSSYEYLD